MHIRPAEPGQPDGRQGEQGTVRKVRLGGIASRVPVQTSKKTSETPLRALVSAIGQSLGSRTPLRGHTAGTRTQSSAKSSLFSAGGKASSSTPADNTRSKSLFSSESRNHGTSSPAAARSTTAASNPSRVPSTPRSSRTQVTAGTPSKVLATPLSSRVRASAHTPSNRRSSLSSSSGHSSNSAASHSSTTKQSSSTSTPSRTHAPATPSSRLVPATPSSRQAPTTPSTAARKVDPANTPVSKKPSMPPRTPKSLSNPNTSSSKPSCIPMPTPRRPTVNSTPGPKQASTQANSKSFFPTTPVSKHTSERPPTTPVSGVESNNGFSTPYGQSSSNQTFYTPTSTLPLTPLQHRNVNVPDSSRKLHFGINVAAMVDQENTGKTTPRPASAVITEATFSFDKNRLAQIKARKNTSQLLKSPAQRIRAPDLHPSQTPTKTPGRVLQQVSEDSCSHFEDGSFGTSVNHSPARRRVANSLF